MCQSEGKQPYLPGPQPSVTVFIIDLFHPSEIPSYLLVTQSPSFSNEISQGQTTRAGFNDLNITLVTLLFLLTVATLPGSHFQLKKNPGFRRQQCLGDAGKVDFFFLAFRKAPFINLRTHNQEKYKQMMFFLKITIKMCTHKQIKINGLTNPGSQ